MKHRAYMICYIVLLFTANISKQSKTPKCLKSNNFSSLKFRGFKFLVCAIRHCVASH